MLLTNRVQIRATRADIWSILTNPRELPLWNPNIIEVHCRNDDPLRVGEGFEVALAMGPRAAYFAVDVTRCVPRTRLRLRHRRVEDPEDRSFVESYFLKQRDGVVEVTQRIDLRNANVDTWTRLVCWAMHRRGREQPQLERLRTRLEGLAVVS